MKYFQSGSVIFFCVHGAIYATNVVNNFYISYLFFFIYIFVHLCSFTVSNCIFISEVFFFNDNNSGPLKCICLVMNIGKYYELIILFIYLNYV